MLDLVSMWKNPKMILFVLLTAGLYAGSIFPFHGLTAFGGYADFGRVGVGVPVAFSFLFGPAAAWGAAIGNVLRDIIENHVDASSYFGFIGNFILGYAPYKMWTSLTAQKPDLRSLKKLALFLGISVASCLLCGLVIGWGLYWLGYTPFMPTAAIIGLTNALWVVTVGAVVLALTYHYVSRHKLLYTDLLHKQPTAPKRSLTRTLALMVLIGAALCCFLLGTFLNLGAVALLPFVLATLAAALIAFR